MSIDFWFGLVAFVFLIYLVLRTTRELINGEKKVAVRRKGLEVIDRHRNPRDFWIYTMADLTGCAILSATVFHFWG